MKGFASGLVWGGLLGALGLVVASEMAPAPGTTARQAEAPAIPSAEPAKPAPVAEPDAPAAVAAPEPTPKASPVPEPAPAAPSGPEQAIPEPPQSDPSVADPAATPKAVTPAVPDVGAVEIPAGSEFARPLPETDPQVPAANAAPGAGTLPVVTSPAEASSVPPATDTTTAATPTPDLTSPDAPVAPVVEGESPAVAAGAAPPAQPTVVTAAPAAPGMEAGPGPADLPPPPPLTAEEQAMLAEAATESDSASAPPAGAAGDRPAPGFPAEVDGVTTGRLPSVGSAPAAASAPVAEDLPPIERYARPFENPEGKPTFAVILVDRGAADLDREALSRLTIPVSFALDPTLPGVGDLAALYRAAGQEVIMLATGIPEGATASDLEVTFQAHGAALPEAVALMDLEQGGFQDIRSLATQIVPIVEGQGRGLITWDLGLNPADQVASREGVRATTVFRRLDVEGEPSAAIRRQLDRAAFKAAQEGHVTVVGDARPETVAALLEWTVEGRASTVALAPVTAVMVAR